MWSLRNVNAAYIYRIYLYTRGVLDSKWYYLEHRTHHNHNIILQFVVWFVASASYSQQCYDPIVLCM